MSSEVGSSPPAISPEERIRELVDLDMEIVRMLEAMGRAIQAIGAKDDDPMTLEQRRGIFQSSVKEALSRMATIDVGQRRSIYALAESGIIENDSEPRSSKKSAPSMLGNLDIGILNSQNDKVGKEIEAEQWTKVREALERLKHVDVDMDESSNVLPNDTEISA